MNEQKAAAPAQNNDNVMAALATIPLVGLIMFFAMPEASALVKSHAKQSNFHLAAAIVITLIGIPLSFTIVLSCIPFILGVADFVLWVIQIVNAFQGKEYKMPILGDFFDQLLK